jgi:PPM family protein phosphatase
MSLITSFAATNMGLVRRENEDSYLLTIPDDKDVLHKKGVLVIVADGVGGGPDGKLASSMAVELVGEHYYNSDKADNSQSLLLAVQYANDRIYKEVGKAIKYGGMATTCTAFVLLNGSGVLCHVGDSRAYLLHEGELRRISKDHTLVEDMVDEGIISAVEARTHPQKNIILKALGSGPVINPDIATLSVAKGDSIMLCSDGLHGCVSDFEICTALRMNQVSTAGNNLMALALERGGTDNITMVILHA